MNDSEVPDEVRRFIGKHIRTVEHVETLVLLHQDPTRWWSAAQLVQELRVSKSSAERRLEELAGANLLDIRLGNHEVLYRFQPATAAIEAIVRTILINYRERRVAMISLIYSKPDPISDFADSFRLGKGDKNA